jgi:hypothetical protein
MLWGLSSVGCCSAYCRFNCMIPTQVAIYRLSSCYLLCMKAVINRTLEPMLMRRPYNGHMLVRHCQCNKFLLMYCDHKPDRSWTDIADLMVNLDGPIPLLLASTNRQCKVPDKTGSLTRGRGIENHCRIDKLSPPH